jgi:polyferredoxin
VGLLAGFEARYQAAFLLLNAWLGAQSYLWVRHFETGGQSAYVSRPAGVEGGLPIAGMMNLKYFLVTGHVPTLRPAAMFLHVMFLSIAFLFRKAFCSWLCPVGTVSEYLGKFGKKLFGRNFHPVRWADMPLRGLKYLLLGFFVWAASAMSANAIAAFMRSPYGIVADVKMLNFFRFIGQTGLIVLGILVIASMLVQNFWCRYLCPYGALLGITSLFSPMRIRRNPTTWAWAFAAGVAVLFFGIVGFAKTAGYWKSAIPQAVYRQIVPHANEASHPMPGDPALQE